MTTIPNRILTSTRFAANYSRFLDTYLQWLFKNPILFPLMKNIVIDGLKEDGTRAGRMTIEELRTLWKTGDPRITIDQSNSDLMKQLNFLKGGGWAGRAMRGIGVAGLAGGAGLGLKYISDHENVAQYPGDPSSMNDILPNADDPSDSSNNNQVDPTMKSGTPTNDGKPVDPHTGFTMPGVYYGNQSVQPINVYNPVSNVTNANDLALMFAQLNASGSSQNQTTDSQPNYSTSEIKPNDTKRFGGYNLGVGILNTKILGIDTSKIKDIFAQTQPQPNVFDQDDTNTSPDTASKSPDASDKNQDTASEPMSISDAFKKIPQMSKIEDIMAKFDALLDGPDGENTAMQYINSQASVANHFLQTLKSLNIPGAQNIDSASTPSVVGATNYQQRIAQTPFGNVVQMGEAATGGIEVSKLLEQGAKSLDDAVSPDKNGDIPADKAYLDALNNYANTQQNAFTQTEQSGVNQAGYNEIEQEFHTASMLLSDTPGFIQNLTQLAAQSLQPIQTLLPTAIGVVYRCHGSASMALPILQTIADFESKYPGSGAWDVSNMAATGQNYSSKLFELEHAAMNFSGEGDVVDPAYRALSATLISLGTPNSPTAALNHRVQMSRQRMKQQREAVTLEWQGFWARMATMRFNYETTVLNILDKKMPDYIHSRLGQFILKSWNSILTAGSIFSMMHQMFVGGAPTSSQPGSIPSAAVPIKGGNAKSKLIRVAQAPDNGSDGTTPSWGSGSSDINGPPSNYGGVNGVGDTAGANAAAGNTQSNMANGAGTLPALPESAAQYLYLFSAELQTLQNIATSTKTTYDAYSTPFLELMNGSVTTGSPEEDGKLHQGGVFEFKEDGYLLPDQIINGAQTLMLVVGEYQRVTQNLSNLYNQCTPDKINSATEQYINKSGHSEYRPQVREALASYITLQKVHIAAQCMESYKMLALASGVLACGPDMQEIRNTESNANAMLANLPGQYAPTKQDSDVMTAAVYKIAGLYRKMSNQLRQVAGQSDATTGANLIKLANRWAVRAGYLPTLLYQFYQKMVKVNPLMSPDNEENNGFSHAIGFGGNIGGGGAMAYTRSKLVRVSENQEAEGENTVEADAAIRKYYNDLIPGYGDALDNPTGNENIPTEQLAPAKHQSPLLRKRKIKLYD